MMVGEVIASIESNAQFTFDYLMLLILAAILAFIGKIDNMKRTLYFIREGAPGAVSFQMLEQQPS